jgi:hypothetical protein
MACPYFLPDEPVGGFSDIYMGNCAAQGGAPAQEDLLERCCNNGYARARCNRAAQSESDAFRFLVKAHVNGRVEVAWSSERDHHPVAVGSLWVDEANAPEEPLERQAWICASNFLKHIGRGN